MNKLKAHLDEQMKNITISPGLTRRILNEAQEKKKPGRVHVGRLAAAAAAICLVLSCSVTALAATVPSVNEWVYSYSPELAEFLYPVNLICEDQGIKLTVLSAANDEYSARVYFSLQDTEGKGRITENLDLCDTADVTGSNAFTRMINSHVEQVGYDAETQTAIFLLGSVSAEKLASNWSLDGGVARFTLNEIMYGKTEWDWFDTGLNVMELTPEINETVSTDGETKNSVLWSGGNDDIQYVLKPDVMNLSLGDDIDFVTITNMGFVEGKFHIQTRWTPSFDNHGQLVLAGENGVDEDELWVDICYFRTAEDEKQTESNSFTKHIEYIFDVSSPGELENLRLWANLVKDGEIISGKWRVDFRFSDSEKLVIDNLEEADNVTITPFSAAVTGLKGDKPENTELEITLKDGSCFGGNAVAWAAQGGNSWDMITMFGDGFHVEEIETVTLDGVRIYPE